jgi:hypothetical protein
VHDNGCAYAYVVAPDVLLETPIPEGAHPWGSYTVITNGITNVVQKTIAQFVTYVRHNANGTSVVKLSAHDPSLPSGRRLPTTASDLQRWYYFLTPYGLTNWLTHLEFMLAYPPEEGEL